MKICVVGAGAIGTLIAVKLHLAGEDVSVVDRSPHVSRIRTKGLYLNWHDGTVLSACVKAFDKFAEVGEQDSLCLPLRPTISKRPPNTYNIFWDPKPWC